MKQTNLKIDINSPHYRVCLYRICAKPFMTTRGRIYCSDKCADNDYNLTRKLKKMKLARQNEKFDEEDLINVLSDPKPQEQFVTDFSNIDEEKVKKNIELLSKLTIDKYDGTVYNLRDLEMLGIDFQHHSYSYPLCNTKNSNNILFGEYETFLINPTQILIYYKNR
ncbi:MAG: hypothetical protein JNJ40_12650 [Bacteroidia bacterium]|nr:hypothetical protein [Bacteroidia bacterium]